GRRAHRRRPQGRSYQGRAPGPRRNRDHRGAPRARWDVPPGLSGQNLLSGRQGVSVRRRCRGRLICLKEGDLMTVKTPNRFSDQCGILAGCAVCALGLVSVLASPLAHGQSPAGEKPDTAISSRAEVPRMPDGRPDFNGSWDNGSGYDFIRPQTGPDGSICISGCAPVAATAGASPPPRAAPDRPRYKPEFI